MVPDAEFIWACGVFEGEGCINHSQTKQGYWTRGLELGSTDRDVVERVLAAFGVGKIYGPHAVNRIKPFYVWRCQYWGDLEPLLRRMVPWLCERRREKALGLLAHPPKPGYAGPGRRNTETHCRRGHPWYGPNADVAIEKGKYRRCRACTRELHAARQAGRKPETYRHALLDERGRYPELYPDVEVTA